MGTEPRTPSLAEVVHRAVDACDSGDAELGRLVEAFEDADEPITAVDDIEARLSTAGVEDDLTHPAASVAVATAVYLAHRRDMLDAEDDDLLRNAARAEWEGHPPEPVAAWLAARGIAA